jgi:hypothetical protein
VLAASDHSSASLTRICCSPPDSDGGGAQQIAHICCALPDSSTVGALAARAGRAVGCPPRRVARVDSWLHMAGRVFGEVPGVSVGSSSPTAVHCMMLFRACASPPFVERLTAANGGRPVADNCGGMRQEWQKAPSCAPKTTSVAESSSWSARGSALAGPYDVWLCRLIPWAALVGSPAEGVVLPARGASRPESPDGLPGRPVTPPTSRQCP